MLPNFGVSSWELRGLKVTSFRACVRSFCSVGFVMLRSCSEPWLTKSQNPYLDLIISAVCLFQLYQVRTFVQQETINIIICLAATRKETLHQFFSTSDISLIGTTFKASCKGEDRTKPNEYVFLKRENFPFKTIEIGLAKKQFGSLAMLQHTPLSKHFPCRNYISYRVS